MGAAGATFTGLGPGGCGAAFLETGTTPLAGPEEEEQQSQQLAHDWFAATVRIVG